MTIRRSASLSDPQRSAVRSYVSAAEERLRAARRLRWSNQLSSALSLYIDAAQSMVFASLEAREPARDVGSRTPALAIDEFEATLSAEGIAMPSEYERARGMLLSGGALAPALSPADAERAAIALEATLRWLSLFVEASSPAQLRLMRIARLSAILAAFVAALWVVMPSRDIALHKPARSSSTHFDTAPWGAVDGDKTARFGFHSQEEDSPWLAVDLESRYRISSVKVFGRGDCCFDQSIPLTIELSDDGVSYHQVAVRTVPFSQADPWVVTLPSAPARFVRLRTMRRSVLVLSEVEVYGRRQR